jgi:hypothetical protein
MNLVSFQGLWDGIKCGLGDSCPESQLQPLVEVQQAWIPAVNTYFLGTGAETSTVPLRAGMRCISTESQQPVTLHGNVWGLPILFPSNLSHRDSGELAQDDGPLDGGGCLPGELKRDRCSHQVTTNTLNMVCWRVRVCIFCNSMIFKTSSLGCPSKKPIISDFLMSREKDRSPLRTSSSCLWPSGPA